MDTEWFQPVEGQGRTSISDSAVILPHGPVFAHDFFLVYRAGQLQERPGQVGLDWGPPLLPSVHRYEFLTDERLDLRSAPVLIQVENWFIRKEKVDDVRQHSRR